eukprot:scaffold42413_cov23-Cyclotella_meneghiniana.AAC.1
MELVGGYEDCGSYECVFYEYHSLNSNETSSLKVMKKFLSEEGVCCCGCGCCSSLPFFSC